MLQESSPQDTPKIWYTSEHLSGELMMRMKTNNNQMAVDIFIIYLEMTTDNQVKLKTDRFGTKNIILIKFLPTLSYNTRQKQKYKDIKSTFQPRV